MKKKMEQLGETWRRAVTVVNMTFYPLCLQLPSTFLLATEFKISADCRLGTKRRMRLQTVSLLIRDMPSFTSFRHYIMECSLLGSSYNLALTKRPGQRLFICCLPALPAKLPISERPLYCPHTLMQRERTTHVQTWSCHLAFALEIILPVAIFK